MGKRLLDDQHLKSFYSSVCLQISYWKVLMPTCLPVILLIYTLMKYEELSNFINTIRKNAPPQTPIFLVGTKSDSYPRNPRQVETQELDAFAKANGCIFLGETSAKESTGVEEVFTNLAQNFSAAFHEESKSAAQATYKNLKQDLDKYTSAGNTFVAYLKLIFSFGQFRLGVEKINLANKLKEELAKPAVKQKSVIESYQKKNEELVFNEINHSLFFSKNYFNANPQTKALSLEEGKLGEILKRASSS
jgi:hypothetical protein